MIVGEDTCSLTSLSLRAQEGKAPMGRAALIPASRTQEEKSQQSSYHLILGGVVVKDLHGRRERGM